MEPGGGADTCQKRSQADGTDLSVSAQGWEGARSARSCREASMLLSPWEAGPLPSHLGSLGKQGRQRLGDACCSSSSAINAIPLRAGLLLALI